jgi:hypothetical protein
MSSKLITEFFASASTSTSETPEPDESKGRERKRGRGKSAKNKSFTASLRYEIGKYAAESSNKKTSEKYSVAESTIRCFKKQYLQQIKAFSKQSSVSASNADGTSESGIVVMEKKIQAKQRGRKSLLGSSLDKLLADYVEKLRKAGGHVNTTVVLAAARGLCVKHKPDLKVRLNKSWAYYQLKRLGYSKRKGTKAARKMPADFDDQKKQFLRMIRLRRYKHDIPPSMILNWDQTAINQIPSSHWTMEKKGVSQVSIVGQDDKRSVTVLLTVTASGDLLPPQVVIYRVNVALAPLPYRLLLFQLKGIRVVSMLIL